MPDPLIPSPAPHTSLRAWFALLAILIVCLPSLTLGIGRRLSTHTMENVALVTSQETFLRMAEGERGAWLISMNDGVPRLEKPPMLTWLNLLAWSELDPATATPQDLTYRARCVTAALGLLMLASIFWMGNTLVDVRFAALATLAVASTMFFQRQARTASYDIHYVAWTTLAVASGLWAIHLQDATALARRIAGWGLCALALAAAALSKNPLPYALALPALIAAIILLSRRRGADLLWLLAATLVSAVPVGAWYWHVFAVYPDWARRELGREVRQPRPDFQVVYYYLGFFGLIVPWTLWLVGALIEPFRIPQPQRKRIAMFALFWFAFIFIALSIPAAKQQRYILSIMPAVGLLIALFFQQHQERVESGRDDRLFRFVSAGTWIVMLVLSLAAPVFLAAQARIAPYLERWTEEPGPTVAMISWPAAIVLGLALMTVCIIGLRWHAKAPWKSAVALALWMILLMTVAWRQEAMIPSPRIQEFVDEGVRLRNVVGDAPIRSLRWFRNDNVWKLNEEFRLYYGRLMHRIHRDDFDQWLQNQPGDAFVIVRNSLETTEFLTRRGFQLVTHAYVDKDDVQEVWRHAHHHEA